MKTMEIHVLQEFKPLLRILQAFNSEHFDRHRNNRSNVLQTVCYPLGAFLGLFLVLTTILLGIWHLIDSADDFRKVVVGIPLILTIINEFIGGVSMLIENRTISDCIEHLQRIVDKSQFFCSTLLKGNSTKIDNYNVYIYLFQGANTQNKLWQSTHDLSKCTDHSRHLCEFS